MSIGWDGVHQVNIAGLQLQIDFRYLDHPNYGGRLFKKLFLKRSKWLVMNALRRNDILVQTNNGIESWFESTPYPSFDYNRASKVPWLEIQKVYGLSSLFIVTHPESAGLAVIEAAMSGARIVVPRKNGCSFIATNLLSTGIDHITLECEKNELATGILSSLKSGVDRMRNHQKLARSHDWSLGATRIKRGNKKPVSRLTA